MTWRLFGSLPASAARRDKSTPEGGQFVQFDRALDSAGFGPLWLNDPRVAAMVVEALRYGQETLHLYDLEAWVILGNHIHVLLRPHVELARITKSLKGYTAARANRLLQREGKPFWHAESFDHWIRSDAQFRKVAKYIEENPVKAGLVAKAADWPWSSAYSGSG